MCAFVFHCCVSNYDKLRGLQQHPCTSSQFHRLGVQAQWGRDLCSRTHSLDTVSTGLYLYWETLAMNHLPSLFRAWAKFIPLQLENRGLWCFASCKWGTTSSSQGLFSGPCQVSLSISATRRASVGNSSHALPLSDFPFWDHPESSSASLWLLSVRHNPDNPHALRLNVSYNVIESQREKKNLSQS